MQKDIMYLKGQLYYHFFSKVAEELNSIRYAIVKGEVLSNQAYNAFGKRYYNDIDILLDKADLAKAKIILEKNGFNSMNVDRYKNIFTTSFSHQVIPYVKTIDSFSIYVDLNFDVFWGEYEGTKINISDFLVDTVDFVIYECCVKILQPIKSLIQLILHHYKDMNSIYLLATRNSITYNMFQDVYLLLKNNQIDIQVEVLYELCKKYDICEYVFYIIYFTNKIYNDNFLEPYIEALRSDKGVELLECYGLTNQERKFWKVDFITRLNSENLYFLIKEDLNTEDIKKIKINKDNFL